MHVINIGVLFIGREVWEGNDGSGVVTEDDNNTDAKAGGVHAQFLGGCPPPTLGGAFWEEEEDNKDNRDKQGQRA